MKGTLFSADFIKDSSGNLRLLELNTDTAIIPEQIDSVNWQPIIDVITSGSLTDIHLIYKPFIHSKLAAHFSSSINSASIAGATVTLHDEDLNTIYPTTVADAADRFVLRVAYDEAAIFDSEYCKNRLNTYKLFYNEHSSSVTEFYYSSSTEYYDSLSKTINSSLIPDVTVKDTEELFNPIDFFKLGHSEETPEQRWDGFISAHKSDSKIIEQFHYHSSSLDSNNHLTSYRTFYVVYGSDLTPVNIHSYRNTTNLDLPSDISSEVDDTKYDNKLADYHYYEYTTNAFKVDGAGLLSTDKIQMADDTFKALGDIEVGEQIKSFFVSGSPQIENDLDTMNWAYEGSEFPSGSFVTSSAVVFKNIENLHYNALLEFVVDGDSQFSGTSKQFLVYDSGSNKTSYKHAIEIDPSVDYFYDYNGNLIDLDQLYYYVTSDSNTQIVELDVEDTDTYIISGSTAFNAVVSHNAPCFVAGTEVLISGSSVKNIEDITIGEKVLTYNFSKECSEVREVRGVTKKLVNRTVLYTFDDGTSLRATEDHPLYSPDRGWLSSDPQFTSKKYQLSTLRINIGDTIVKADGTTSIVTGNSVAVGDIMVYNLVSIEANHNYYANNFLVHNRCFVAGTKITLPDSSQKDIETINAGDAVLTYNEETGINEEGTVGEVSKHEVNSVIRLTLDNENIIVTTEEHPFYVLSKGWTKAKDLQPLDVCKKVDGSESLVSTVELLEENNIVYNLLSISDNHNFYANEILVHNK